MKDHFLCFFFLIRLCVHSVTAEGPFFSSVDYTAHRPLRPDPSPPVSPAVTAETLPQLVRPWAPFS